LPLHFHLMIFLCMWFCWFTTNVVWLSLNLVQLNHCRLCLYFIWKRSFIYICNFCKVYQSIFIMGTCFNSVVWPTWNHSHIKKKGDVMWFICIVCCCFVHLLTAEECYKSNYYFTSFIMYWSHSFDYIQGLTLTFLSTRPVRLLLVILTRPDLTSNSPDQTFQD
jgi:hypothetical protein